MKRLSLITQFKIEFLLPFTGCRKVLGKIPFMGLTNNFYKVCGLANNFWKVCKTHKNFMKFVDWKVGFKCLKVIFLLKFYSFKYFNW